METDRGSEESKGAELRILISHTQPYVVSTLDLLRDEDDFEGGVVSADTHIGDPDFAMRSPAYFDLGGH